MPRDIVATRPVVMPGDLMFSTGYVLTPNTEEVMNDYLLQGSWRFATDEDRKAFAARAGRDPALAFMRDHADAGAGSEPNKGDNGAAAAEAKKKADDEAAAEAKKKADDEAAAEAKKKADDEAAAEAKKKADDEAASADSGKKGKGGTAGPVGLG